MTIAVHIALGNQPGEVLSTYNFHCFSALAGKNPNDHFIFIFDKPFDPALITLDNITPVVLGPVLKNRLLRHYWYQFKLPRLLSRFQVDAYVNQDKMSCANTSARQYLVLEELAFVDRSHSSSPADKRYLSKYFPRFVTQAHKLIVFDKHTEALLSGKYPSSKNKIIRLKPGAHSLKRLNEEDEASFIENISGGKAYFVFLLSRETQPSLLPVLKAFSIFKKWQKSGMLLVILRVDPAVDDSIDRFEQYKYRSEVVRVTPQSSGEMASVLAGSYAAIYLPDRPVIEQSPLLACSMGTALLACDNTYYRSLLDDHALFCHPVEQSISENLMRLYKDESLRGELATRGRTFSGAVSWDEAAAEWDALLRSDQ